MKSNKIVYDSELSKKITTCVYFIINDDRMSYIERWVLIGLMNYLTKCGSRNTYDKLNSFRVYPEKFKEWYGIDEKSLDYYFGKLGEKGLICVKGGAKIIEAPNDINKFYDFYRDYHDANAGIEEMQYKFYNSELCSLNVVVGKCYDITILWDNIMELRNNLIEAHAFSK